MAENEQGGTAVDYAKQTKARSRELAWAAITYLCVGHAAPTLLRNVRAFLPKYAGAAYVVVDGSGNCKEYNDEAAVLADPSVGKDSVLFDLGGDVPIVRYLLPVRILRLGEPIGVPPDPPVPQRVAIRPAKPALRTTMDDDGDDEP